jgi:uncharacterized protein (TIGR03437 family)
VPDLAGNFFILSNIVLPSGLPQIHVQKVDLEGNTLAAIDFGGSNVGAFLTDFIGGAAVDRNGNLIVTGSTSSADFPLVAPLAPSPRGATAFVTKIDSQLKTILFSTTLGGDEGITSGGGIALDKSGNIYVTGSTTAAAFPVSPGAYQTAPPSHSSSDSAQYAFLTEISADLKKIVSSTFFGSGSVSCNGSRLGACVAFGRTYAASIAIDGSGNVAIAGQTTSNQLPLSAGAFGSSCGDCNTSAFAGFAAEFSPDLSKLLFSTYIPVISDAPNNVDVRVQAMAIDADGNIILGGTSSKGLPVTNGALQPSFPGLTGFTDFAGFVMKIDVSGRLVFSTYFGEEDPFLAYGVSGIAVDSQKTIWLTGSSIANRLPGYQAATNLGECFLAGLSPDGSNLTAMFTAPRGVAGLALALNGNGLIASLGSSAFLAAIPGEGPSVVGIANSAGYTISGRVAPYELISLFGLGLGPQSPLGAQVAGGVVSNSLGGVQIFFDGTPSPLLYAGPTQINAVVPSSVYGQDKTKIRIVTPSGAVEFTASVQLSQPGVFTIPTADAISFAGFAAALNQDGSPNTKTNPAALGSILTVWATGIGLSTTVPADGSIVVPPLGKPSLPVAMYSFPLLSIVPAGALISGPLSLEVLYAGDASGAVAGVSQVNFRLPSHVDADLNNVGFALQAGSTFSATFTVYLKQQ